MTTEDIIELVAQAHMAGQHYENSDLDNASYGDAIAYAIYTAVPKITAHNSNYYDMKKLIEILDNYRCDSYGHKTIEIVFEELKEFFNVA